jgi:hypothetical protein
MQRRHDFGVANLCLINMAHTRLPPGEAGERTPDLAQ